MIIVKRTANEDTSVMGALFVTNVAFLIVSDTFAIEVKDLTVAYKEKPVLWDIDLQIPKGYLVSIVGPNGAGKTTLIKSILGLLKPASGKVLYLEMRIKISDVVLLIFLKKLSGLGFPDACFGCCINGALRSFRLVSTSWGI